VACEESRRGREEEEEARGGVEGSIDAVNV
jgi:hypothetical protein